MAQLDALSDWRPGGRGFNPRRGRQHSFVEMDHEIFSTVILSLLLIQEGQLSVSGERMCTILVNCLEDQACPVNMWLGKLTALDMTPLGWLGRKTSTQIMSDSDYPLISCPLCKSKTLWDIFMILGRDVEQDQTTCHVQNDNSAFLTFGVISLFLFLTMIIHWFRVRSVSQNPFEYFYDTW